MKFLAITALLVTLATQSFAQTCGDICTEEFWETAMNRPGFVGDHQLK